MQIFRPGTEKKLKSLPIPPNRLPKVREADAWIETNGNQVVCCIPLLAEVVAGVVVGVSQRTVQVKTEGDEIGSFPVHWGPLISQIRINDRVQVAVRQQRLYILPTSSLHPVQLAAYLPPLPLLRAESQPLPQSGRTIAPGQNLSNSAPGQQLSHSKLPLTEANLADFHRPSEENFQQNSQEIPKAIGRHRLPIASLQGEFKWNAVMVQKFRELSAPYSAWRRSRGDGNCFYRCLGVLLLEHLCRPGTPIQQFQALTIKIINQEDHFMIDASPAGLPQFKLYIIMLKELFTMKTQGENVFQHLQYLLQRSANDAAMIVAMRHYTASYLQRHSADPDLVPFLDNLAEVIAEIKEYGKEAEGTALFAAARCFDVVLHILTVNNKSLNITETVYGPAAAGNYPSFSVLHLPGHYNYLVKREVDAADHYDFTSNSYSPVTTYDSSPGYEYYTP